ncbi:ABC transporter permease [Natronorubrum tibetense]|uniref:Spermidine/putrescine ABC transporter permease n=1 Tax=Natronorubrum tibetense GA33 TaxID=1114856 RepID=L9VP95_9EURY|nr:ABC transporter permease [Natronorubrum tibetense]ELY38886.1 spermidine/putrescine ABC transporter permease [Natronorubrum tibetense GA33]
MNDEYSDRWLAARNRLLQSDALVDGIRWIKDRRRLLATTQAGIGVVWMVVFLLAPLLYILAISFWVRGPAGVIVQEFTWANYHSILIQDVSLSSLEFDNLYLLILWQSLKFGFVTTVVTLVLGYVPGYVLGRTSSRWLPILLLLVILPFWVPLIIRYYAWVLVLGDNGVITTTLGWIGIERSGFLYNEVAVISGMVQVMLPFMILPIYNSVAKIDGSLVESAKTMGAGPLRAFYEVSFPLSLPGISAGCILVFILSVGSFLAPALLGGSGDLMIANLIEQTFGQNQNWPVASAMAIVYLLVLFGLLTIFNRIVSLDAVFGEGN